MSLLSMRCFRRPFPLPARDVHEACVESRMFPISLLAVVVAVLSMCSVYIVLEEYHYILEIENYSNGKLQKGVKQRCVCVYGIATPTFKRGVVYVQCP